MKCVSVAVMRQLEQAAIAAGISGYTLMQNAGRGAAEIIRDEFHRRRARRLAIVTGKGNNAGDGLVVAASLDLPAVIFAAAPPESLGGDAALHFANLPRGLEIDDAPPVFQDGDLIVDALLGTGLAGPVREPFASRIEAVNRSGCPVIALDLPSGLDGDTGKADAAIRADLTITFALPKAGLFRHRGPELSGPIRVVPIGLPACLEAEAPAEFHCFAARDGRPLLSRLENAAHKNTRGRVLILAGSAAYPGAGALAVAGAFAGGAGLVRLATPQLPFSPLPAATILHQVPGRDGRFGADDLARLRPILTQIDAIVAGPGWDRGPDHIAVIRELQALGKPLLLDADALNAIAEHPGDFKGHPHTVITPHPGEAARLFKAFGAELPDDRRDAARRLARLMNVTVLLKGPQTVVATPDGDASFNTSGSPALAVAGSGDILAGLTGSLLAEGLPPAAAARLAAYLHGRAGECIPQRGLTADHLPPRITAAILETSPLG